MSSAKWHLFWLGLNVLISLDKQQSLEATFMGFWNMQVTLKKQQDSEKP